MASSWLSRAASMAQAAQEAAKEAAEKAAKEAAKLREEAQAAASGLAQGAERFLQLPTETKPSTVDLLFQDGPLGFELEGPRVVAVTAEGQAEHLGLRVGSRLLAVEGEVIPAPPAEDSPGTGDARVKRLIRKWIQGKARPISLTFEPHEGVPRGEGEAASAAGEDAQALQPLMSESTARCTAEYRADEALLGNAEEGWAPDLPGDFQQDTDGWGHDALDLEIPQEAAEVDDETNQETAMSFDVADQPPLEQAAPEACPGELTEPAVDRLQQEKADATEASEASAHQPVAKDEPQDHEESAVVSVATAKETPFAEQAMLGSNSAASLAAEQEPATICDTTAKDKPSPERAAEGAENADLLGELMVDELPEQESATISDTTAKDKPSPERAAEGAENADLLGELMVDELPEQETADATEAAEASAVAGDEPEDHEETADFAEAAEVSAVAKDVPQNHEETSDATEAVKASAVAKDEPQDHEESAVASVTAKETPSAEQGSNHSALAELWSEQDTAMFSAEGVAKDAQPYGEDASSEVAKHLKGKDRKETAPAAGKPPPPPSRTSAELDEALREKQEELESLKWAAEQRVEEVVQKAKERFDQAIEEHEKERQALQKNLQKLQKNLDDAKAHGEKMSEKLKAAEELSSTAQAEARQSAKQLKKSQDDCQKLTAKLEKESAKVAELKQNVDQVIKDATERDEARMREIKQLRDKSENELKHLKEKSDNSSKDAETLRQRQLEEASMELKELHSESAQQKEMLSELVRESSAEAAKLREHLGAVEVAAEADRVNAEQQQSELEGSISRSRQELRAANERSRRAERELEQARAECQELLSSATQRDDRVEVAQALLEGRVRSLQEQVEVLRAESEEARASETMKEQAAQTAEAQYADLHSSSQTKEQEWREERSILERRVQSLQDELQQCRRGSFDNEVEHQDALLAAQRKAEEASEEAVEAGKLVQMLQLEASEARSRLEASQAQDFSRSSELAELKEARQQLSEQAADATASCESHKQLIRALQQSMAEQSQQAEAELAELRRLADATPTIQRALSSSTPQRKSSAGEWRALLEEEDNEPDGKVDSPSATPADHNSTTKPEEQVVGDVTDSLLEQLESTSGLGSGRLPKGAGAPETAGHEEVAQLWDRINYLEKRCRNFQKKLDARPIIYQAPTGTGPLNLESGSSGASAGKPNWEPWLRDVTGPVARRLNLPQGSEQRVAAVAAPFCQAIEAPLRSFTQRLLRQDRWLWVFYAHLLVLYAIAASCIARNSNPVSPAECVDTRLKQLQAAKAASGG